MKMVGFTWFGHLHARMFRFWAQSHPSLLCLLWILHFMFETRQDNSVIPKKMQHPTCLDEMKNNLHWISHLASSILRARRWFATFAWCRSPVRNPNLISLLRLCQGRDSLRTDVDDVAFLKCFKAIKRISKMVIYAWWTVVNSPLL